MKILKNLSHCTIYRANTVWDIVKKSFKETCWLNIFDVGWVDYINAHIILCWATLRENLIIILSRHQIANVLFVHSWPTSSCSYNYVVSIFSRNVAPCTRNTLYTCTSHVSFFKRGNCIRVRIINGRPRECHNKKAQPIPRNLHETETTKLHVNNSRKTSSRFPNRGSWSTTAYNK